MAVGGAKMSARDNFEDYFLPLLAIAPDFHARLSCATGTMPITVDGITDDMLHGKTTTPRRRRLPSTRIRALLRHRFETTCASLSTKW